MTSFFSIIRRAALIFACLALPPATYAADEAASVHVAGHGTGKIQSFVPGQPNAPTRVYAEALPVLNAMLEAGDGFLLASTGAPAQAGTIVRIDPETGIPTGTFWDGITTAGKAVGRLTGLALADGVIYAAEADAGVIHAIDALTGAWKGVAGKSDGAVISQIFVGKEGLLAADFGGQQILLFRSSDGTFQADPEVLHSTAPAAPWGVVEDKTGRIFYSTAADEIVQLTDGSPTPWVSGEKARQVIYLGLSRDGKSLLVPSNATGWASAWSTENAESVWERQLPTENQIISMLEFSDSPANAQSFLFRQEGVAGAKPTAGILVKTFVDHGLITHLGWDTEGGGREINNLLRRPLRFAMVNEEQSTPLTIENLTASDTAIAGTLVQEKGNPVGKFQIVYSESHLKISAELDAGKIGKGARVSLTLDLNPRMCATSFHASKWTTVDTGNLPGLIIAPDMGTMEVTAANPTEVRFTGDRPRRETTLVFTSGAESSPGLALQFSPVNLANPTPGTSDELWQKARRGWWNLPLATSQWGPTDGTGGSIAGIWGNNVISNPVGATLFWLADHIVLAPEWSKSVAGSEFLKYTVEYYLSRKILPSGEVAYVDMQGGAMDASPALMIAFWGVVESTGDLAWMNEWLPKLKPAIDFMNSRDVDGDGLIESKQSGNAGTGAFGDTAWDTYSSGHKNAYVNALAHRAYKSLEALALKADDQASEKDYGSRAAKLKASIRSTFYNPETGWIAWWKSEDGVLHDVHSDVPTSMATIYGLLEPADAKVMLDKYWTALQSSGFDNFALGVPLNYRPVLAALQFTSWGGSNPDGSETFQRYLNGGCTVSNTLWFLTANDIVGNTERADGILEKMVGFLRRTSPQEK